MTDWPKYLLEFLKLAPRYLAASAVVCAIFLFSPSEVLNAIGVLSFTKNNSQWIGVAFIASIVLFSVDRLIQIADWIRNRMRATEFLERQADRLCALTEDEKQILRYYIAKQTRTNYLRIDDGVVSGLVSSGIIYQSSPFGHVRSGFPYNISDFAWDHLNKHHSELLDGETNFYRNDKETNEQRRW